MSLTEPIRNPFDVLKLYSKEEIREFYLKSNNKELVKKILIDNHDKDNDERNISGRYEFLMEEFPTKENKLKSIKYFTSFCKKEELINFFAKKNHKEITEEEWNDIFLNTGKLCINELLAQKEFPKEILNKKAINLLKEYHHEEAIKYIREHKIDVNVIIPPLAQENKGEALNELYKEFKKDIKQETTDNAFIDSITAQVTNPMIMSGLDPISQMMMNDNKVTISDGEEEVIKDKSEVDNFITGMVVDSLLTQNNIQNQVNTIRNTNPNVPNNNQNNRNAMSVMLNQNLSNTAINQGIMTAIDNNQFKEAKRIVVEKEPDNHQGLLETLNKKSNQLNNKEKMTEQVHNNPSDLKKIHQQKNDLNDLKTTIDKQLNPEEEIKQEKSLENPRIKKDLGLSL